MAVYSNGIINNLSRIADIAGTLTKGKIDLLTMLDLQWKNNFEVIFYPAEVSLGSIAGSVLDTVIANLYIQNIQGLNYPTLEYEDVNGIKHLTGITAPEEITMDFLETDIGLVRLFIQTWMNSIYTPVSPFDTSGISFSAGDALSSSDTVNTEGHSQYYRFKDKQSESKKNAIVILKGTTGLPALGGWIKLEGLRPTTATGFDISQEDGDPMIISVPMKIDMLKFIIPLSSLPL